MSTERVDWDRRHAAAAAEETEAPDAFFLRALARIGPRSGARALDLACGAGRHALELARRGWCVAAWDFSSEALARLQHAAARAGLAIATRNVDVAAGKAGTDATFDLVVIVNFLDRDLIAAVPGLLAPGGHLIAATYTVDWAGAHPSARWRLRNGEWAHGIAGLDTVLYEENSGRAGVLARRGAAGVLG